MKLSLYVLSLLALTCASGQAEINQDQVPFSLTLDQLQQWSPQSKLADKRNVSTQPLASRFVAPLQGNKDSKVKVLIAPDGMNNFANYLEPQQKFNLYNFTHWSQIDVLNWFAGTATQTINIPARPWVEAAHKNGVKVIGSVFLGIARFGGSADTVAQLLQRDKSGGFPAAHKLVDIAEFYGFDGWLMNQETDLTRVKDENNELRFFARDYDRAAKLAAEMQVFMAYLTSLAPPEMEIHWYDSMIMDGRVKWQNALNDKNQVLFQQGIGAKGRVSDAIFLNYWWDEEMLKATNHKATSLQRSPYEVYSGIDLWPERKAQSMFVETDWLTDIFPGQGDKALSSIALFANNVNFNFDGNDKLPILSGYRTDKNDHRRFYAAETRFFAGDDLNLAIDDANWPGLGRYVPAKSSLTSLPFLTHFNTGHGLMRAEKGQVEDGEWHNMAEQDILPTWQFAVEGNDKVSVYYNFNQAYNGGSSLAIEADLRAGNAIIPLYQTHFEIRPQSQLTLVTQTDLPDGVLSLWMQTKSGQEFKFDIPSQPKQWQKFSQSLEKLAGQQVIRIGLKLAQTDVAQSTSHIGLIGIH
ncbi:endo-beta-N-acetylglucosaminidase [uncultured Paraglaciecola sp.]|uniref:endo-beta-N-acetylglucosaminidase n=1 Tax=uncultured Paraglaciecola sp. TaxID=1765024 RepID=UPI00260C8510|nr:endo-beta-N-acetylglucosaminidase [uncultured Paraglaciecola sp.]